MKLFKRKKEKNAAPKINVMKCTGIRAFRFTEDVWKMKFPEDTKGGWEKSECPDNVLAYTSDFITRLDEKGLDINDVKFMEIITLDDEYLAWLKSTGRTDSEESMREYANTLDNENAIRLLKKNRMNREIREMMLPFLVIDRNKLSNWRSEFIMGEKVRAYLTEYLQEVYGQEVYVVPYYVTPQSLSQYADDFKTIAMTHFDNDVNIRMGRYNTQDYGSYDVNIAMLYISFFLKEDFDTNMISMNIYTDDKGHLIRKRNPHMVYFSKEYKPKRGFYVKEIDKDIIRNDIGTEAAEIYPFGITREEFPRFHKFIQDIIQKEALMKNRKAAV